MSDAPPTFTASAWYRVKGRGWMASVECDVERDRGNPGLAGRLVIVDGEMFFCVGVERNMPLGPIRPGERIGLLVQECANSDDDEPADVVRGPTERAIYALPNPLEVAIAGLPTPGRKP